MATPSPRQIVRSVRDYARRHDLLRPGPLVLAVSGGTDSTALALIMAELRDQLGLVLHVAHFDHRARPRAAAADAAFVADLANQVGATLRVGRAERAPRSEDDARRARYAFLRRVAADLGASAIATGHTRDDQAETVLLHLVRGSGLAGLAGMRPSRDGVVRPLLCVGRAETAALCASAGITPREDETNASPRFARNRVRLRVLPELEQINPRAREALARFADAAAQLEDGIRNTVHPNAADLARDLRAEGVDLAGYAQGPDGLRLLADAWRDATGRTLTTRQRDALGSLVRSADGTRRIDLPGGAALREYGRLRRAEGHASEPPGPARLARGAWTEWHGWRIGVDVAPGGHTLAGRIGAREADRLIVRSRHPGDRIAGSHRKVQDVFVDAKVPLAQRDAWPLLAVEDEIVWIPGLTPPPLRCTVPVAAERVGDDPTDLLRITVGSSGGRQVASMREARHQGGKRGRA